MPGIPKTREQQRYRRHLRVRKKVAGTPERPRVSGGRRSPRRRVGVLKWKTLRILAAAAELQQLADRAAAVRVAVVAAAHVAAVAAAEAAVVDAAAAVVVAAALVAVVAARA